MPTPASVSPSTGPTCRGRAYSYTRTLPTPSGRNTSTISGRDDIRYGNIFSRPFLLSFPTLPVSRNMLQSPTAWFRIAISFGLLLFLILGCLAGGTWPTRAVPWCASRNGDSSTGTVEQMIGQGLGGHPVCSRESYPLRPEPSDFPEFWVIAVMKLLGIKFLQRLTCHM